MVSFEATTADGMRCFFSLTMKDGGWWPMLADGAPYTIEELREDFDVDYGGFKSVVQYQNELRKLGYTDFSNVEEYD